MGELEPEITPLPTPAPNVTLRTLEETSDPCGPPWTCEGSGGWCGCECYCCPPCPCYTGSMEGCILIGSPKTEWFPEGCDCEADDPCSGLETTPTPLPPTPTPPPTCTKNTSQAQDCANGLICPGGAAGLWIDDASYAGCGKCRCDCPGSDCSWKCINGVCTDTGTPCADCYKTEGDCLTDGCGKGIMGFIPTPTPTPQPTSTPLPIVHTVERIKRICSSKELSRETFKFEAPEEKWDVPFPEFNYNPEEDFTFDPEINEYIDEEGNIVRIMSEACSIPCTKVDASVSFDGCCMLNPTASGGGGKLSFSLKAAKKGFVTVEAPEGKVGCAEIVVTINGEETRKVFLQACESASVVIEAKVAEGEDPECCQLCSFVSKSSPPKTVIPECEKKTALVNQLNKETGEQKLVINKRALIKKLRDFVRPQ